MENNVNELINEFLKERSECVVAIGYGSGVIKQNGYDNKKKPQIDILIGVKDTSTWHKENIKFNPSDYSKKGIRYFKLPSKIIDYLTGINFLPYIDYKGYKIKLGVFSLDKVKEDLVKGKSFYLAGRLSKPNLIIKCNNEFKEALDANRKMALWTGACLKGNSGLVRDLYVNISKFSYLGDIRNGIKIFGKTFLNHENPNKIYNLVDGSFQEYEKIFKNIDCDFIKFNNDKYILDLDKMFLCSKEFLPINLYYYLEKSIEKKDYLKTKELLIRYFSHKNRLSSLVQALKGFITTDLKKTKSYLKEKEKKAKMK